VFGAEAFMANTSVWVVGCPIVSSSLPASMVVSCGTMDVCGWVVWGICMVWIVALVVEGT
jgi:hypothetical protein